MLLQFVRDNQEGGDSGGRGGRGGDAGRPRRRRLGPKADPKLSRGLEYGAAMLDCYSTEHGALGIADLATLVRISRSTTHRYAITLVALDYLEQDAARKYRLARHAADVGYAALEVLRERIQARAALERLREQVGHTVSLAALDGERAVYVYRLFAHRRGQYSVDRGVGVGASVPLHCTAIGKLLLASLGDEERRATVAELEFAPHGPNAILDAGDLLADLQRVKPLKALVSDEEHVQGARSIAALVAVPDGARPLAVDVTVPAAAYSASALRKHVGPVLEDAAAAIAQGLRPV